MSHLVYSVGAGGELVAPDDGPEVPAWPSTGSLDDRLAAFSAAHLEVVRVEPAGEGPYRFVVAAPWPPERVEAASRVRAARQSVGAAEEALVSARAEYLAALRAGHDEGLSYSALGRLVGVHAATISNTLRRAE